MPLIGEVADEAVIKEALPQAKLSVEALDALIGDNEFFAGDELSLADLHVAPIYDYFSQIPEGEAALSGTHNLRRWWDGISQREKSAS